MTEKDLKEAKDTLESLKKRLHFSQLEFIRVTHNIEAVMYKFEELINKTETTLKST